MKNLFKIIFLAVLPLLFTTTSGYAENLGLYEFNLNTDIYSTIDKAINSGFRIKVYGSNLSPDFAAKMFQLSYAYEIANVNHLSKNFENEQALYRIVTNKEEIKYAKGFNVYNFLNGKGDVIGSFIFDENLIFINKNKYNFNIIPVKIYKESLTIDMIFFNNDNKYIPLFIAVSFFKIESVKEAIRVLNQRFGNFIELQGKNITARYWEKDNTSVSNYFGLNDRFVFYNIDRIKVFNHREKSILKTIDSKDGSQRDQEAQEEIQKINEGM